MSKLLINAINNRYKGDLFENVGVHDNDMPVKIGDPGWEHRSDNEKNFLFRSYTIEGFKLLRYFLDEVLVLSEEHKHHPIITIYGSLIDIKLYTAGLNDVSDVDVAVSKKIDEIIEDINIIRFGRY